MSTACPCLNQPLVDAVLPAGFCAFEIPVSISRARSVISLPGGSDLLALERQTQSVIVMEDTDGDGVPDSKRAVAQANGLNHGMALFDGYLYASSDTTVYRWPWDVITNSAVGDPTIVINNINADGNGGAPQGHTTRTLEFDLEGRLYVSVGSNENVDPDSFRSRIRRFNIVSDTTNIPSSAPSGSLQPSVSSSSTPSSRYEFSVVPFSSPWDSIAPSTTAIPSFEPSGSSEPSNAPSLSSKPSLSFVPSLEPSVSVEPSAAPTPQVFPLDFLSGEVFADGIRNAVAMAHDKHGVLWAADTGADNLQREDLGGDITNDNPAEELLKLPADIMGTHFGYPYCWTEYRLDEPYALGRGTAWSWPSTFNITVTDDACRTKYGQASVSMQAHSSPLGITFYNYKPPEELPDYCPGGALPERMDGYVFLAFHGSWNRDIPTGYKLVYVEMDADGNVASEPIDLLAHIPPNARWGDGFRPVDVDFDECGRLLLSSDGTGGRGSKIVRIESIAEQCGSTRTENFATSISSATAGSKWSIAATFLVLVCFANLL